MDRQLERRQHSKMICAIAFASIVGLPTSIYEEASVQGYATALSSSVIAVSPPDQMSPDETALDLQGENAANPAADSANEKPSSPPHKIDANPIGSEDAKPDAKSIASEIAPSIRNDDVNLYLWSVYERSSAKIDGHGDFTWKDAAAAARVGLPIEEYVIGGMDPDFRELLFAAGQALDAAGIDWTILSAFRDDYRQSLAAGLKARSDNSFHGGSVATGGYGHGLPSTLQVSTAFPTTRSGTGLISTVSNLACEGRCVRSIQRMFNHARDGANWHHYCAARGFTLSLPRPITPAATFSNRYLLHLPTIPHSLVSPKSSFYACVPQSWASQSWQPFIA
jgi:hypothetical protein